MARFDDLPPSSDKPLEPRPEAPLDEDLDDATIPAHAPNVTRVRPGNAGGVQSGSSDRSGSSEVNAGSGGTPGSFDAFEEPQTRIVAPATVFGHRFEVVKQIGRGGMGEVFLVRDRQIESREVALKLVRSKYSRDARYRELFFQEIRSSQGFVSEHVVQVRDVGQLEDGQLFLTMDYVKGESLSRLLRREKVIQPRHALEITRQVLLGLSSGHERGLIHRDVKPSNIMLEGRAAKTESNPFGVKVGLLDFGLAALTEHVKEGRQPGTPQYMSPEQASGQRLDARSDLFAVGVLLYEMVSGQRPFEGATEDEITQSVIDTNLVPLIDSLDGVDKGLKRILRKALQKEREKRFPSAAEFISAIEKNNAFLGERTSGSWLSFSTAALAILSVGLSFLYSQSRTEVTELKASLQSQGTERRFGDLDQFDRQELQSSLDAVRAEVKEQRALLANRDQRISQLEAERSGLRGELDAAERKMIDLELAQKDAVDKRLIYKTESDGEVVLIRRANEALTASLFALWAKYEALQMNRGRSRELVLAGSLDDLLGGIANSSIHLAGNAPIQAAISERGVSAHSPGVAYLLDLERAAKTLTRAADSALIETSSLKDYASALATVERLSSQATFAAFESEVGGGSERWIGAVEMRDQDVEALLRERLADPSAYSNSLDRVLERERQAAVEQAIEAGKLSGWLAEIDPGKRPATQPLLGELDSNIQFVLGRNFTDPDQVREVQRLLFGEDYQPSVANERLEQIKAALAALRQMGVAVQEQFEGQVAAASQELVAAEALGAAAVKAWHVQYGAFCKPHLENVVSALATSISARLGVPVAGDHGLLTDREVSLIDPQLEGLVDLIEQEPAAALLVRGSVQAETYEWLRWLASARFWYTDGASRTAPTWVAELLSRPLGGWQEWMSVAALQYQLDSLPGGRFPMFSGTAVYAERRVTGPDKPEGWVTVEAQPDATQANRSLHSIRVLNERGAILPSQGLQTVTFTKQATNVLRDGQLALETMSLGARVKGVCFWNPSAGDRIELESVRAQSSDLRGIQLAQDLSQIARRAYAADELSVDPELGYKCLLVQVTPNLEFVIHPALGVVQKRYPLIIVDLVHLQD